MQLKTWPLFIILLVYMLVTAVTAQEIPSETVVVQQAPAAPGKEVTVIYIPAVPDEFLTAYPAFPVGPNLPWPPPWDVDTDEACLDAIQDRDSIRDNLAFEENILQEWLSGDPNEPSHWMHNENGDCCAPVMMGTPRWAQDIRRTLRIIEDLKEQLKEATRKVQEAC